MKVTEINGVKIYDLNTAKTMEEYFSEAKWRKTKLKHMDEYRNWVTLFHEFEFKASAQKIKVSQDE